MKNLHLFFTFLLLLNLESSLLFSQIRKEQINSIHDSKVNIFKIFNDNALVGHSVWISSSKNPEIKVKYFADRMGHRSIYARYIAWKDKKTIVAICSGAFTNENQMPKGIAIDDGKIINRDVDNVMDGLVVIYPYGCITVSDLSEKNLKLPNSNKDRPLDIRNEYDKNTFLKFATNQGATVFQTQLLIYNDIIKCKIQNQRKERRFLIVATDTNGDISHIILNIHYSVKLYDAAKETLEYLKKSGHFIVAMLNLDTGAHDMLNVFYPNGNLLSEISSSDASGAVNLILFYFEPKLPP